VVYSEGVYFEESRGRSEIVSIEDIVDLVIW
jgi:hypothetical protein